MSANFAPIAARCWTQEQINFLSDVIAVGTIVKSERLRENAAPGQVEGIETTFLVLQTWKGKIPPDGKVVVRYSPSAETLDALILAQSESAAFFLYLTNDTNNRFRPTSGSKEVALSIRRDLRAPAIESRTSPFNYSLEYLQAAPALRKMAESTLQVAGVS